jgi:hypothetical protein
MRPGRVLAMTIINFGKSIPPEFLRRAMSFADSGRLTHR